MWSDALGFGQGGASVAVSYLLRQVQNFAAHGMVGYLFTCFSKQPQQPWGCLIKQRFRSVDIPG